MIRKYRPTLKPFFRLAFFLVTILVSVGAQSSTAPAPAFKLPTLNGEISSAALKGSVVLVDFWASWCGPCRESFPWMNEMTSKYASKGLQVVAINVDQETDEAKKFLKRYPALFKVAFDPDGMTPESWGVMGMPSSFLVDRDGNIVATHIGFHLDQTSSYEENIRNALND